ncbi:S9 family peptidase [Roseimaritima ulvae]|nr:DPP IV N-terminal domain-containing protein [Roseimaritima ulvae]
MIQPLILFRAALLLTALSCADALQAQSSATKPSAEPPPLSVKTLYHPEHKYDFDGPSLPAAQWSDADPQSQLAVRRGKQWMRHNLETGREQPWKGAAPNNTGLQRLKNGLAIVTADEQTQWITRDARSWRHPTLSPDGKHVAFVEANDMYIVDIESGQRLRVTSNGSETRLNGVLDWSYQEEIYGRGNFKAFWWSPDSQRIALLRLDIRDLYEYTLADSRTPRGSTLTARYPKVGDPIPVAELWVTDLQGELTPVHRPNEDEREQLIVRVGWHPDSNRVAYQVMNRVQSWLELRLSPALSGETNNSEPTEPRVLVRDESATWVEVLGEPRWLPSGDFLWLSDQPIGRRRVWRVSSDGRLRIAITPEDMDVREIEFVSPDGQTIYVTADRQRGSIGQQVYRVDVSSDDSEDGRSTASDTLPAQLSSVTAEPGWHVPTFSPDGRWMLDQFSKLEQPPSLRLVDLRPDAGAKVVRTLAEPGKLRANTLPVEWLTINTSDGVPLPAYLIRPANVQRGGTPVLIETYGGPQAASAVDRWTGPRYLYRQMLAQQGIAVLVTDNRSSAGRGIADTWAVHRQLGVVELQDTLAAVGWLKQQPWVNADAIGLRGWSFGGFLTAYALTHCDAFAAGVAGGSPTDWRNYDAIYTERYMGLPSDNPEGYNQTSVNLAAQDLHGALLLIHGELDDNVHPANTLQLVRALQAAGKPFEMMLYPGAQHGIRDAGQEYHMMDMVTRFLHRQLKP